MKAVIISLIIVLIFPAVSYSQHISTIDLLVNGGISLPYQPEDWKTKWMWGFNGGFGALYRLSSHWALQTNADFYSFAYDDYEFNGWLNQMYGPALYTRYVDAEFSFIIGLTGGIRYMVFPLTDTISPYVVGGVGYYLFVRRDILVTEQEFQGTVFGTIRIPGQNNQGFLLNGGIGIDIHSSSDRSYFLEVLLNFGPGKDDNLVFVPIRAGIRQKLR